MLAAGRVPLERLSKPRDVNLDRLRGSRWRTLPPQLVDQPLGSERLIRVDHQQRKQRPLLGPRENNPALAVENLKPTKDAEVHPNATKTRTPTVPARAKPGNELLRRRYHTAAAL